MRTALIGVGLVGVVAAVPALAETNSATLAVSADVINSCGINNMTPLDFGDYVPGSTVDASASFTLTCAAATDVKVTLDPGKNFSSATGRRMKHTNAATNSFLRYLIKEKGASVQWPSEGKTFTAVNGTGKLVELTGTILNVTGNLNAAGGPHADTVQVVLTWN